jgi:YbbR domain-containing protein
MVERLRRNAGALVLAFFIAITVWVVAINQDDPSVERSFSNPLPIEYAGLSEELIIVGDPPSEGIVTLRAPASMWEVLTEQDIRLTADLSTLQAGTYLVTLEANTDRSPIQIKSIEPQRVTVSVEPSATRSIAIQVSTLGAPAPAYQAGRAIVEPGEAIVVGPESAVMRVAELRAFVNLANMQESIDHSSVLQPIDMNGIEVEGIQIIPDKARVTVEIRLQSLYRVVSVIPAIEGREALEAAGQYRVTEISVTPSVVTVFSSDQQALDALPGYVETAPISIIDATANVDRQMPLDLPEGFSIVGEQSVLVQVGIVPIEISTTITREIEIQGLGPDLYARLSPTSVSLLLTGPAAMLDNLKLEDARVIIDLFDLTEGTYQLTPQVIALPADVQFDDPIPATIEVVITREPPPTVTPSP